MGTTEMQSTKTTYIARRDADSYMSKATSVQKSEILKKDARTRARYLESSPPLNSHFPF